MTHPYWHNHTAHAPDPVQVGRVALIRGQNVVTSWPTGRITRDQYRTASLCAAGHPAWHSDCTACAWRAESYTAPVTSKVDAREASLLADELARDLRYQSHDYVTGYRILRTAPDELTSSYRFSRSRQAWLPRLVERRTAPTLRERRRFGYVISAHVTTYDPRTAQLPTQHEWAAWHITAEQVYCRRERADRAAYVAWWREALGDIAPPAPRKITARKRPAPVHVAPVLAEVTSYRDACEQATRGEGSWLLASGLTLTRAGDRISLKRGEQAVTFATGRAAERSATGSATTLRTWLERQAAAVHAEATAALARDPDCLTSLPDPRQMLTADYSLADVD